MPSIMSVSCWRQQSCLGEIVAAIITTLLSLSPLSLSFLFLSKNVQTYRRHLLFIHHFRSAAVDILLALFCLFRANYFIPEFPFRKFEGGESSLVYSLAAGGLSISSHRMERSQGSPCQAYAVGAIWREVWPGEETEAWERNPAWK